MPADPGMDASAGGDGNSLPTTGADGSKRRVYYFYDVEVLRPHPACDRNGVAIAHRLLRSLGGGVALARARDSACHHRLPPRLSSHPWRRRSLAAEGKARYSGARRPPPRPYSASRRHPHAPPPPRCRADGPRFGLARRRPHLRCPPLPPAALLPISGSSPLFPSPVALLHISGAHASSPNGDGVRSRGAPARSQRLVQRHLKSLPIESNCNPNSVVSIDLASAGRKIPSNRVQLQSQLGRLHRSRFGRKKKQQQQQQDVRRGGGERRRAQDWRRVPEGQVPDELRDGDHPGAQVRAVPVPAARIGVDPSLQGSQMFEKLLQYVKCFSRYKNPDAVRQVRETLSRYGLAEFELCTIGNLCPDTSGEATALVPFLKSGGEVRRRLRKLEDREDAQRPLPHQEVRVGRRALLGSSVSLAVCDL